MNSYRFSLGQQVRVKPLNFFTRVFASKERRQFEGQTATVGHREIGYFTKRPIYTVALNGGLSDCFFQNELETA